MADMKSISPSTTPSKMLECSQGRIGDYESGRCTIENITLGVALKISNALGCTIEDLFTAEEQDE